MIFELIDIAQGRRDSFSSVPSEKDWENLFEIARKQSILGVLAPALDTLPANQAAPLGVYAKWMYIKEMIEESNTLAKARCKELNTILESSGRRCCILKGQSIASRYPQPGLRQGGDIDVWVDDTWESTYSWAKQRYRTKDFCYHHVEAEIFPDIPVELHFRPSWMNSPSHNRKIQRYFKSVAEKEFTNYNSELGFCVTDDRFTAVFSVIHTFRHFFAEGIGLRQLMDCHYAIAQLQEEERKAVMDDLSNLGISKFTAALMYVLGKVFSLDSDHLLCAPDGRKGEVLLREVMLSGNFGKYDGRYGGIWSEHLLKRALMKILRVLRFIDISPAEAIFAAPFKTWQHFWIKRFSVR